MVLLLLLVLLDTSDAKAVLLLIWCVCVCVVWWRGGRGVPSWWWGFFQPRVTVLVWAAVYTLATFTIICNMDCFWMAAKGYAVNVCTGNSSWGAADEIWTHCHVTNPRLGTASPHVALYHTLRHHKISGSQL